MGLCEYTDPSGLSVGSYLFSNGGGDPESEAGQGTRQATEGGRAGKPISMDEAIDRAVSHVGVDGFIERTGNGLNFQFRSMRIDANGNLTARIGRLDVNPLDPHVSIRGPHLNLDIHVNGRRASNLHFDIDPLSIRLGDIP
jgi:hypothetical protein